MPRLAMIIIGAHPIATCSYLRSRFIFILGHARLSMAIGVNWGDDSLHSNQNDLYIFVQGWSASICIVGFMCPCGYLLENMHRSHTKFTCFCDTPW
jgi:hypothetical protein